MVCISCGIDPEVTESGWTWWRSLTTVHDALAAGTAPHDLHRLADLFNQERADRLRYARALMRAGLAVPSCLVPEAPIGPLWPLPAHLSRMARWQVRDEKSNRRWCRHHDAPRAALDPVA